MEEKIKTYIKLHDEFETLAYDIMSYFRQFPLICSFDKHAAFESFEVDDKNFIIKYFDKDYDLYDCDHIVIPLEYIYNDSWKEYIQELDEQKKQIMYEREIKYQKQLKEDRYNLYKELQQEFDGTCSD